MCVREFLFFVSLYGHLWVILRMSPCLTVMVYNYTYTLLMLKVYNYIGDTFGQIVSISYYTRMGNSVVKVRVVFICI